MPTASSGIVQRVLERPGLILLISESDAARTDVLQRLETSVEQYRGIVIWVRPSLDTAHLHSTLLTQLGSGCESPLKSRQLMAIQGALSRLHAEGRCPILIVDDAHTLSTDMLEEIRLCLNMQTAIDNLLDIVMAGRPELLVTLRRRDLRHLKQRVGACYMLDRQSKPVHEEVASAEIPAAADSEEPPHDQRVERSGNAGFVLALLSAAAILAGCSGLLLRRFAAQRKGMISCTTDSTG